MEGNGGVLLEDCEDSAKERSDSETEEEDEVAWDWDEGAGRLSRACAGRNPQVSWQWFQLPLSTFSSRTE